MDVGRLRGEGQLHVEGAKWAVLCGCRVLGGRRWTWHCCCARCCVWFGGPDTRRTAATQGLTGLLRSCYLPMQLLQSCMPVCLLVLLLLAICVHLSSFGLACGATGASSSLPPGLHRRLASAALTMELCILDHTRHQGVLRLLELGMGLQEHSQDLHLKQSCHSPPLQLCRNNVTKTIPLYNTPWLGLWALQSIGPASAGLLMAGAII